MNTDGFVNQQEREAAQECALEVRNAHAALRLAIVSAQQAGFGGIMLHELEELLSNVNEFQTTYDLV